MVKNHEPTLFTVGGDIEELHPSERAYYKQIAVHHNWHRAADAAMKYLAHTRRRFSADDLRDLLGDCEPTDPNAIGGLFYSWSRNGLIQKVGYGCSRGVKRHGGVRAEWVGIHNDEENHND